MAKITKQTNGAFIRHHLQVATLTKNMKKKLLFIGSIGLFTMACGGNTTPVSPNTNINANAANVVTNVLTNTANTANVANTTNTANANKPANTAAKPAPSGPTRISFKKGEIGSTQNIDLAPGASMQFALGATGNQNLFVTSKSKELSLKMLKSLGDDFTTMEDGTYMSVTKGNNGVKGDIIFEVKNTTAKAIKSSIKIEIQDVGD
jgi:hypothetical protein